MTNENNNENNDKSDIFIYFNSGQEILIVIKNEKHYKVEKKLMECLNSQNFGIGLIIVDINNDGHYIRPKNISYFSIKKRLSLHG